MIHLIKQAAEKRTTRSWECSIANAAEEIQYINKWRKSAGYYLNGEQLNEVIAKAYSSALRKAALEAFEGQYSTEQLAKQVDQTAIQNQALELIEAN